MSALFSPDSQEYRFLETVGELFFLNLFYLFTCLPVVTIGIATTALCQSIITMLDGGKPLKVYFSVWKTDWKQSTGVWLLLLALIAAVLAYIYLFIIVPESPTFWVTLVIILLAFALLAVMGWVFPLMAQFNNTTANHLKNAAVMACAHPIKSLIIVATMLIPLAVLLITPYWFIRLGFIWCTLALSLICYSNIRVLRPALAKLIAKATSEE